MGPHRPFPGDPAHPTAGRHSRPCNISAPAISPQAQVPGQYQEGKSLAAEATHCLPPSGITACLIKNSLLQTRTKPEPLVHHHQLQRRPGTH